MRYLVMLLATASITRCEASNPEIKWGGGLLLLEDYERSVTRDETPASGLSKKATTSKNVTFGMFWLDADAEINQDLSISARLSDISAAKWNALMVEGEGSGPGSDVVTFQHAYVRFHATPSLGLRAGLLAVERNMEPLQAHFTPQKTSWSSFWKATMGNMQGINVQFPLPSRGLKLDGEITVSKYKNGDGTSVIRQTGQPDVFKPENDSVDTILAIAVSKGPFQIKPLMAYRSSASGSASRTTWGFTGSYAHSPGFNLSFGAGFSALSTGDPRDSANPRKEDNRTMFLRLVPVIALGKGSLTCDLKYSTYTDKSLTKDVTYRYPVADIKYMYKYNKYITIVFPFVRYLGESYTNDTTNRSRNRLCTYVVLVATF